MTPSHDALRAMLDRYNAIVENRTENVIDGLGRYVTLSDEYEVLACSAINALPTLLASHAEAVRLAEAVVELDEADSPVTAHLDWKHISALARKITRGEETQP